MITNLPAKLGTMAITISPKDRVAEYYLKKYLNPLRSVYDDDKPIIQRALNRCSKDYTIYPELDNTGRLHYHGEVHINNDTNWKAYTCGMLKTIGFIKVKSNPNGGWKEYCKKEWDQTKQILKISEPITYEPLKRGPKVTHDQQLQKVQKSIIELLSMENL